MPFPGPEHPRATRLPAILSGLSLFAAAAWLVSRVWLGLDFTDEMQYYGGIQSLMRTGRFFVDDLALQQLGYFFFWPLFKLHALCFPDQSFLVLFGRLLLLAAYGGTGALFWRAATQAGGFSRSQKLAGLAAFFAWVPFQIFALSYNTTSYLLVVALTAAWITRDPEKFQRYAVTVAGLLTVLTYTYPPVGLTLILVAVGEVAGRRGRRAAVVLLGATALSGLTVAALMFWFQGDGLWSDLQAAIEVSRAYGVGATIRYPYQFPGWVTVVVAGALFVWRLQRGRPFPHPWGHGTPPVLRWAAMGLLAAGSGALLGYIMNWRTGYFAAGIFQGLLLLLAASIEPADGAAPALRIDNAPLLRWAQLTVLLTGHLALLAILLFHIKPGTGYVALSLFLGLLSLLALDARPGAAQIPTGLAMIGTITGAVVAYTSSNGLHNFGIGAAGVIPFLVLYGARHLDEAGTGRRPALTAALLAGIVGLLLLGGVLHPYLEQPIWNRFQPMRGVPAYRGIWTSPVKVEAVERFQTLVPPGSLQGQRILVIGPHPWLYFALGGQPATSMVFMHFDGTDAAYRIATDRLFRDGMPDAIVLATTTMPQPFAAKLMEWSKLSFSTQVMPLPAGFIRQFKAQMWYDFPEQVYLLRRAPGPR